MGEGRLSPSFIVFYLTKGKNEICLLLPKNLHFGCPFPQGFFFSLFFLKEGKVLLTLLRASLKIGIFLLGFTKNAKPWKLPSSFIFIFSSVFLDQRPPTSPNPNHFDFSTPPFLILIFILFNKIFIHM